MGVAPSAIAAGLIGLPCGGFDTGAGGNAGEANVVGHLEQGAAHGVVLTLSGTDDGGDGQHFKALSMLDFLMRTAERFGIVAAADGCHVSAGGMMPASRTAGEKAKPK
jgi:hypothetical protein